MIPVDQTINNAESGDCFPACLASILEVPLVDVPNYHGPDWRDKYQAWLKGHGLAFVSMSLPEGFAEQPTEVRAMNMPRYTILAARSPRFDCLHAVVCCDGVVVHDPSPLRHMGIGEWKEVDFLVPLDPANFLKKFHAHTPR